MKTTVALVALFRAVAAVTGAAEGFAKGVTGGGSAAAVYPTTNAELVSYLGDSSARNIILTKTFDFTTSEGTTSATGCAPWGTGSTCQLAINKDNWCTNYEPNAPKAAVKYNNAGVLGILVKSNKSLIGQGSAGIIKGKGLRIVGSSNIIIQNIHVTGLNPQYVWGGDAITLNGADMVWVDHVKTSLIGRQHYVFGNSASNRVTVSNSEIDGQSSWSATCDGHHYWGMYFTGSNDMVTFKNNYVHHTSGRSPKVSGNTLLHFVNNYMYANSGHAFESETGAKILAEGNIFDNVVASIDTTTGQMFSSPSVSANAVCTSALGRVCQVNKYISSGTLTGSDSSFLSNFGGKNVATAATAASISGVKTSAGFGKI
ncbi:pectin lyase [Ophiostoma piceae UAMH 11346]|uniref:pectin lyase n=1 Tax=Ophiostoma piceae (strain UAMH 11346) TaxID=1262450 RepID=S3BS25_OPHP1|nr:pectin lyase [Ophiostoma piceae UAMH 11346]